MLNQQPNENQQQNSVEKNNSKTDQNNSTDWQKNYDTYQKTTEEQRLRLNNLVAKVGNETWTDAVRSGNSTIQETEVKVGSIHNTIKNNSGGKFIEEQKNIFTNLTEEDRQTITSAVEGWDDIQKYYQNQPEYLEQMRTRFIRPILKRHLPKLYLRFNKNIAPDELAQLSAIESRFAKILLNDTGYSNWNKKNNRYIYLTKFIGDIKEISDYTTPQLKGNRKDYNIINQALAFYEPENRKNRLEQCNQLLKENNFSKEFIETLTSDFDFRNIFKQANINGPSINDILSFFKLDLLLNQSGNKKNNLDKFIAILSPNFNIDKKELLSGINYLKNNLSTVDINRVQAELISNYNLFHSEQQNLIFLKNKANFELNQKYTY
ncbi:MAG: hypothetical protein ACOZAR_04000 [Patescibacteria group bacterium]